MSTHQGRRYAIHPRRQNDTHHHLAFLSKRPTSSKVNDCSILMEKRDSIWSVVGQGADGSKFAKDVLPRPDKIGEIRDIDGVQDA